MIVELAMGGIMKIAFSPQLVSETVRTSTLLHPATIFYTPATIFTICDAIFISPALIFLALS